MNSQKTQGSNPTGVMVIEWLQDWYATQCDGEWEHEYGIKIQTMDNPGWWIIIDLKYTNLENFRVKQEEIMNNDGEWYSFTIIDAIFTAFCSPNNLLFVLEEFKLIAELGENSYLDLRPKSHKIPIYENFSISKGLPAVVIKKLIDIIDVEKISSKDMPNRGEYLAQSIKPYLEEVTRTTNTDFKILTMLVYKNSWDYINSRGL